jgi:membrane-associated protease RseP (regulator of RpoE activity)
MRRISGISILIFAITLILVGCGENRYQDKKIGIEVQSVDPDLQGRWGVEGVVVTKVFPGSPAERAGLEEGEMIYKVSARKEVKNRRDVRKSINEGIKNERMVTLELSDGRRILIAVRSSRDSIGVIFDGTKVKAVDEGGPSALSGLKPGDQVKAVIITRTIRTLKDYKKVVKEMAKRSPELTFHTGELSGVKLAAVRALGEIGGSEAVKVLLQILESEEELFREPAAKALEKLGAAYSTPELLSKMIEHLQVDYEINPEIRASCAVVLAKLKPVEAIPALIKALYDPVANVRFKAGVALASIGSPALEPLIKELNETQDPNVQDIAVSTLGEIGTDQARDALISAYSKVTSSSVRLSILNALAEIGDEKAAKFLTEVSATETDPQVKVYLDTLLARAE